MSTGQALGSNGRTRIVRIATSAKGYGGDVYERYIDGALATHFDYQVVRYAFALRGAWRLLEAPLYLAFIYRWTRNRDHFLIRNFHAAFLPLRRPRQGITIIHHVDPTGSSLLNGLMQRAMELLFRIRRDRDEPLVVISQYWKAYFERLGYRNVHLIYCPFDLPAYQVSDEEVAAFRAKHGLLGRPIVYIGNPQRKKGAHDVCGVLRDEPVHLVTSGEGTPVDGARHLRLPFREYLCLLKSSAVVVTLSRFLEGWCRVAHEAMLMGTRVVGSGAGGMRELLEGGGQPMVAEPASVREAVRQLIAHPEAHPIDDGYVRSFTLERFERAWIECLRKLGVGPVGDR